MVKSQQHMRLFNNHIHRILQPKWKPMIAYCISFLTLLMAFPPHTALTCYTCRYNYETLVKFEIRLRHSPLCFLIQVLHLAQLQRTGPCCCAICPPLPVAWRFWSAWWFCCPVLDSNCQLSFCNNWIVDEIHFCNLSTG